MVTTSELIQAVKGQHPGISPIVIMAPTPRSGSTLLQRAINQGGQAVIYGENFVLMEQLPKLVVANVGDLAKKIQITGETARRFLEGNRGLDASALFPDYLVYRRTLLAFFFQLCEFYREQAGRDGFGRWGLKHQLRDFSSFRHFVSLVPGWRGIVLYRDAVAVASSIRARWPRNLQTGAQFHQLGMRWQNNLRYLLKLEGPNILVVKYEDLVASKEEQVTRIETHLGIALAREAFAKRVNAHVFDARTGKTGETYVAPATLPEPLVRTLLQGAEPLYGQLGYCYSPARPQA
ncbi:MAG: sulfotransferase [Betaproteobacteria bacterium]|nr:sulfotransferase [Betaproteobacteria bacterium]